MPAGPCSKYKTGQGVKCLGKDWRNAMPACGMSFPVAVARTTAASRFPPRPLKCRNSCPGIHSEAPKTKRTEPKRNRHLRLKFMLVYADRQLRQLRYRCCSVNIYCGRSKSFLFVRVPAYSIMFTMILVSWSRPTPGRRKSAPGAH